MQNFFLGEELVALDPDHVGIQQQNLEPRGDVNYGSGSESSISFRQYGLIVDGMGICGLLVRGSWHSRDIAYSHDYLIT